MRISRTSLVVLTQIGVFIQTRSLHFIGLDDIVVGETIGFDPSFVDG